MFYCEPCRLVNDWPYSVMRWRSVCEICRKYSGDCNDIPSIALTPVKYPSSTAAKDQS
jgi:hypothetical protein